MPYSPLPRFITEIAWIVLAIIVARLSLATVIAAVLLGIRAMVPHTSPLRAELLSMAKRSPQVANVFVAWLLKISFYGFVLFIVVLAVIGVGT